LKPFTCCPVCGGELAEKRVEKLLKGGCDTASIKVPADVCLHCGERLYNESVVKAFEEIRRRLRNHEYGEFRAVGQSFTVGENFQASK